MQKNIFVLLALALTATASNAHPLHAFEHDHGVFIANPVVDKQWLAVDDDAAKCAVVTETKEDRTGSYLLAADGKETFLAAWSVIYNRADAKAKWAVVDDGHWDNYDEAFVWSRLLLRNDGSRVPKLHHFLWQGPNVTFINDPRPTNSNFYVPNAKHGNAWYVVDEKGGCTVFTEKSRSYADPDMQTAEIGSPTGTTWKLETGRASNGTTQLSGTWLAR